MNTYFSEPEINENEYNFLKSLNSKWKWFILEGGTIFVYEIDPWGKGNPINSDTEVDSFDIDKGLFNDFPNDDSVSYSISKMIDEFETRKALEKVFPINKESKNDKHKS